MRLVRMSRRCQRGAAAVELAVVFALFCTALFGAMEMGRLLWTWNAAVEATRLGARMAAVCDIDDPDIKARMRQRLPALSNSNIVIDMKIRIVSPARINAESWAIALKGADRSFTVETDVQALHSVNVLVNGSRPDVVIADPPRRRTSTRWRPWPTRTPSSTTCWWRPT
jgi:Flp pilus assembly protein TadG